MTGRPRTATRIAALLASVTLAAGVGLSLTGCGDQAQAPPAASSTSRPADTAKAPGGTPDVHPPKSADADKEEVQP